MIKSVVSWNCFPYYDLSSKFFFLILYFLFNISLPNNFNKKPVGVITKKNTTPITIGATIDPNNKPNLNQSLFNGVRNFEFNKPKIKKIKEIPIDHFLIPFSFNNGKILIIKKNTKKTIPKLRFVPILILDS